MSNSADSKIHIFLSQAGTFRDIVQPLISGGASLHIVDGGRNKSAGRLEGKWRIVFSMFSLHLLKLRNCWRSSDRVLLIGWQAISILAMMKIGLIKRPQKILIIGCFVHSNKVRYLINKVLRLLKFEGLGFITFSRGESENLIKNVGMSPSSVHFHLWRQNLDGRVEPCNVIEGDYIFSGGYSNRDYDLLISAMQDMKSKLIIVASSRNDITKMNDVNINIYRDLDEADFEKLLAQSKLVVLPLHNHGEACGQSVLIRTLRNGKPLVVTRHESVEDYLGMDYPGFVPAGNRAAMRSMVELALTDSEFRNGLASRIKRAAESLDSRGLPSEEILEFLAD
jgi:glycosyltransferase involved in cell wall biosynthesis